MADVIFFPAPQAPTGLAQCVAENIRLEAARRNVSQGRLAHALGTSQPVISERFRGKRMWPLDDLERVAALFGLDVEDLMRRPRPDSNREPTD